MNATAIILLIGVCSFWAASGIIFVMLLRFRQTLEALEETMQNVNKELRIISPSIAGTMQQLEITGRNIGRTASEVETLVHGVNNQGLAPAAAGVINYLPLAIGVFRHVRNLLAERRSRGK